MILTCSQCSTRYQVDAAKFQAAGRKVRCAKCGHIWHQGPQEDERIPIDEPAAAPAAETVPDIERPSAPASPAGLFSAPSRAIRAWQIGAVAGWLSFVVVVGLVIWGAVALRQQVVEVWPKTVPFYAKLGFSVNTFGIAFQDVSYRIVSDNDMPVLLVRGKLVNITHRDVPVPKVRVGLVGEDGNNVYHWDVDPGVKSLRPGQSAAFNTRLASPPGAARRLQLHFVAAGKT